MKLWTPTLALVVACHTAPRVADDGDVDTPARWTLETAGAAERIAAVAVRDETPVAAVVTATGIAIESRGRQRVELAADRPRVAFSFDGSTHVLSGLDGRVRHATGSPEWTWTDVGPFRRTLALTADGFGGVFALATSHSHVVMATRDEDGAWSQRPVANAPANVANVSLTSSSLGLLAAFATDDGITLLTATGRAWQRERVTAPHVGEHLTARSADEGTVWILYQDSIDGALRALRREPDAPWRYELVDWGKDTGHAPSLRVEADGRAHACYFAGTELRYALRDPHEPWVIATVATGARSGGCDITLGDSGALHIAFLRDTASGARAVFASVDVPSRLELTRRTVSHAMPMATRKLAATELTGADGIEHLVLAPDGDTLAVAGADLTVVGTRRGRVRTHLPDFLEACRRRSQRAGLGLAVNEHVVELARVTAEATRARASDDGRSVTAYLGAQVTMPAADAKPPLADPLTAHRFATVNATRAEAAQLFALEVRGFTDEPVFTGAGDYVAWVDGAEVAVWSRADNRVVHTLAHPSEVTGVQILDDHHIACQWRSAERSRVRVYALASSALEWEAELSLPLRLLPGTHTGVSAGNVVALADGSVLMAAPKPPEEDGPERLSGLWTLASDRRTGVGPTSEGNWAVGDATRARLRRVLDTELDGRFHLGGHSQVVWRFARDDRRIVAATLDEVGVFDSKRGQLLRAINIGAAGSVVDVLVPNDDRVVFLRREAGTTIFSTLRFGLERQRKKRDPVLALLDAAPWLTATPLTATGQLLPLQVPDEAQPGLCLLALDAVALDTACVDEHGTRIPRRPGAACALSLAATDDLSLEVTLFDNNGLRAREIRAGLKGWTAPDGWLPIEGKATAMALAPAGDRLVVGDSTGNLFVGEPRTRAHQRTMKRKRSGACPGARRAQAITALALSPALPLAAAGYGDGQLLLWNLSDGKRVGEHQFPCDAPTALTFDAASETLYVGTAGGRLLRIAIEPM